MNKTTLRLNNLDKTREGRKFVRSFGALGPAEAMCSSVHCTQFMVLWKLDTIFVILNAAPAPGGDLFSAFESALAVSIGTHVAVIDSFPVL